MAVQRFNVGQRRLECRFAPVPGMTERNNTVYVATRR